MISNDRGGQASSDRLMQSDDFGDDGAEVDSSYGDLRKRSKAFMNTAKQPKEKAEVLIHIDNANQKKYANLKKTSKSRFDGVHKYLHGAFLSKQLPIPTFNGPRSSDKHAGGDSQMALLNDEDMARNDSSDLLMTKVGHVNTQGKSATNLRKANVEMSQLLKHEINFSKETVERVKRGHSIFDLDIVQEAQTNKQNIVIKKNGLQQQLDHFLELSVADTTFVPQSFDNKAKSNVIDLIQNSPQKKLQRVMKARLVHNLKKRQGGGGSEASPNNPAGLSPFQQDKKTPIQASKIQSSPMDNAKTQKKFKSVMPSHTTKLPMADPRQAPQHVSTYANTNLLNKRGQNRHLRVSSRESDSSHRWQGKANTSDMSSEHHGRELQSSSFFAQRNDSMHSSHHRNHYRDQNRHSSLIDYYDMNSSTQQSTYHPARNAITSLAIVRAATQIRDTLANASSQMRNKLTSNKTSPHQALKNKSKQYSVSSSNGKFRGAQTEASSRLKALKPDSLSTSMPQPEYAQMKSHINDIGGSSTQLKQALGPKNNVAQSALSKKGGSLLRRSSVEDGNSIDSSDIEEEKLPPFLGNVEQHLKREYNQFQRMFEIPINPAFFKSTNIRQPKKLQSLQSYLKDQGIASTLPQHQIDQRERSKIEYRFWKQGIDFVIPGFNDMELESRIVKFVFAIDFEQMSDKEREMLFSEPLRRHPISRKIQDQMEDFMKDWQDFLADQAQQYMQRLSESYKLRMGKVSYKEHLIQGKLPPELMQNDNFHQHKLELRSCKKHGRNPTPDQVKACFICQVLLKKLYPPPLNAQQKAKLPGKKAPTEEEKMKQQEADELKRVSLKDLRKEVNKMPVFSLAHPPVLDKDQGGDSVSIDVDAADIQAAAVSPFASQTTIKDHNNTATTDQLNRSLTKQNTVSPGKSKESKNEQVPLTQVGQVNAENILRLREEADLEDQHSKEINELVSNVESLCKARKMVEHEQKMTAQQYGQVFVETPADVKKREEFENQFKTDVAMIFKIKARKMLVDRYNQWIRKLASDLDSLDSQVKKLTAGDLRIAKKRDGKIKFNAKRNPNHLEVFGAHDEDFDSADEDELEKKRLFKKCFNKNNIALGRMIKTTERLQTKTQKYKSDLEKLLLRSKLDRPSMIQEKFRIIWKEQDGAAQAAALQQSQESNKRHLVAHDVDGSGDEVAQSRNIMPKMNPVSTFDQNQLAGINRTASTLPSALKDPSQSARRTTMRKSTMSMGKQVGSSQSVAGQTLPVSTNASTANQNQFNKTTQGNFPQAQQQQRSLTHTRTRRIGGGRTSDNNYDSTPALGDHHHQQQSQQQLGSSLKVGEKSNLKSSFNKAQSFNSTAGAVMDGRIAMKTQVTFSKFANDAKAREMSVPADQASLNALPAMQMGRSQSINSQNAYFDQATTGAASRGGGAAASVVSENIAVSTARDRKSTQSRESRVKLMSIRDVLHDRQARRMRDNGYQKDGYKYMLGYMARRRREFPQLDIQREEVKIMNGIKLLVESGWVVDESYFKHLCEVSCMDKIVEEYFSAKSAKKKIDAEMVTVLRFVQKFAENLGMPNYFGFDRLIAITREPNEIFFTLDPSLYFSEKKGDEDEQSRQNKDKLGNVDLLDDSNEEKLVSAMKKDPPL